MEDQINRRALLLGLSGAGLGVATAACDRTAPEQGSGAAAAAPPSALSATSSEVAADVGAVRETFALDSQWQAFDPFLFCVHHDDAYPSGNAQLGPAVSLAGRNLGSDFEPKDGFRMYHGDVVPGFPRHPHRGFETVTVTRRGFIDHSDSMGATARYGNGDVQWMTAGKGIVHAEMFPLLSETAPNPTELFQIWLNLPKRDKFVAPYFSMFWNDSIPRHESVDANGRITQVTVIAGSLAGKKAPTPPPSSWASRAEAELAIWSIRMEKGATFTLPATGPQADRTVYFFRGSSLTVGEQSVASSHGVRLQPGIPVQLRALDDTELLLLQGRPIGEAVVKSGPFVMNSSEEIRQAYADYRRTQFGGWPWDKDAPVHTRDKGRFAVHADGRKERAT